MMAASPLREQEEQLRLLTLHLRPGRGGLLIVVTPDAEAERTLAEELRLRIKDEVKVEEATFTAAPVERLSLSHHLSTLPEPSGKAAVFVFGLDNLPLDARTTAINAMNWGRERLRWSGYAVVLWVRPGTPGELGNRAPDFFSWRSDVFEFDLPADPVERQRRLAELRLFAPATLDELRERYGDYVLRTCQWLDFRGLLQVRNVVRLPLDEVFIPLQATASLNYVPPPPSSQASDVDRTDDSMRERYYIERRVGLSKVTGQHQRLVVLGDPGSGKSTLLRFLALTFARGQPWAHEHLGINEDRLPILTPLSAFSEAHKAQPDLSLAEFLPRYFSGQGLPDFSPLFNEALCNGRGLVLLDGLDEMLTYDNRADVARSIADFATAYPTARVVVTSRVAGYAPGMLPADFATYTLAPFHDDAIKQFARQWSRAFEAIGLPAHTALPPDGEHRAILRAESLVAAVAGHPGVWRLATNPLLLTLLALIHHQGTRLPHRRVDLYRLCVEALAETWNLARSLTGRPIDVRLGERRLDEAFVVRILAPIAYWMHETKPAGLVERDELEAHIAEQFVRYEGTSTEEAAALAHDFLALVREQMGLLVERASDAFSFLHLSVQEYLAARFLSECMDGFERLKPRLHHPRWREVVLLTAGSLRGDYATAFVENLLNAHGQVDNLHHHVSALEQGKLEKTETLRLLLSLSDLLLAVRCLGDDVPVRASLRLRIRDIFLDLWRRPPFDGLSNTILRAFEYLRGSPIGFDICNFLLKIVQGRNEGSKGRARASVALGRIGRGEEEVVKALLSRTQDTSDDEHVRQWAAEGLGHAGRGEPEVVKTLLNVMRNKDTNIEVRESAARALGRIGHGDAEVAKNLQKIIQDGNEDERFRGIGIWALGQTGQGDTGVVKTLLNIARAEKLSKVMRLRAVIALGETGQGDREVVKTLLSIVQDGNEDENVRWMAAVGLSHGSEEEPEVVEALVDIVRNNEKEATLRWPAVLALDRAAAGDVEVRRVLLDILQNPNQSEGVRSCAAWVLGQSGERDAEVMGMLLSIIRNSKQAWAVRRGAVEALGRIGQDYNEKVIDTLLDVVDEPDLRRAALNALWNLLAGGASE
jgi:HEAT repeat protein/energy-coupling factor transporter ATP-binding protein EcfA2